MNYLKQIFLYLQALGISEVCCMRYIHENVYLLTRRISKVFTIAWRIRDDKADDGLHSHY
jgi:hypothetical protein